MTQQYRIVRIRSRYKIETRHRWWPFWIPLDHDTYSTISAAEHAVAIELHLDSLPKIVKTYP
jgi:hypothetical protein